MCVIATVVIAHAAAAQPSLTVEVAPNKLELCAARDDARVQLAVTNSATTPLEGVTIETFSDTGVTLVDMASGAVPSVAKLPHGTQILTLRPSAAATRPGTIWVRVFHQVGDVRMLGASGTLVLERTAIDVSAIAELEVKRTAKPVNERGAHTAYVVVKNKSPYAIDVAASATVPPVVAIASTFAPIQVVPHAAVALPLTLTAHHVGDGTVVVQAALTWNDTRCAHAATLVTSFDVEAESKSTSELTTLVGVPTLLFLPGFIVMTMSMLLWSLGLGIGRKKEFPFPARDAVFWLFAVCLSFLAIGVASLFGRDLLDTFTLSDLVTLWFGCLVSAAFLHLLLAVIMKVALDRRDRAVDARMPASTDSPIVALAKLEMRGQSTQLARVKVNGAAEALRLLPAKAGVNETWIAGPIVIDVDQDDETVIKKVTQARERGDAAALAQLLTEHGATLRPRWSASGGPRTAAEASLTVDGVDDFVREDAS